MPPTRVHREDLNATRLLWLPAIVTFVCGCTGPSAVTRPTDPADALDVNDAAVAVSVLRYGRYTLVEIRPVAAQRDLLEQIVDVSLPPRLYTTVGDALNIVLEHTGYQLCDAGSVAQPLYALPLPVVHLDLGPLTLRDALKTLAGPAWTLEVDSTTRRVCFSANASAAERPPSDTEDGSRARSRRSTSQDEPNRARRRRE